MHWCDVLAENTRGASVSACPVGRLLLSFSVLLSTPHQAATVGAVYREWADICMKGLWKLAEERREFMQSEGEEGGIWSRCKTGSILLSSCYAEREGPGATSLCKLKVSAALTSIPVWARNVLNGAVTEAAGSPLQ